MTLLYMYYPACFVLVEHFVYHKPISVLINIFTLLALCLLSILLVLTLTKQELHDWPSIASMLPQKAIVVMRMMGGLDCLHDFIIYIYIMLLCAC